MEPVDCVQAPPTVLQQQGLARIDGELRQSLDVLQGINVLQATQVSVLQLQMCYTGQTLLQLHPEGLECVARNEANGQLGDCRRKISGQRSRKCRN